MATRSPYPLVRVKHGTTLGKFHSVDAAVGSTYVNGSLDGFSTFCGRMITGDTGSRYNHWQEASRTRTAPLQAAECCTKCFDVVSVREHLEMGRDAA